MAYWQEHSLGCAPQSAFGTSNVTPSDYAWLQCDKPKVQLNRESEELELLTGQVGAAGEKLQGRRHGTLSFTIPLEGLVSGYNPTTQNPGDTGVLPPWFILFANSLGSYIGNVTTAADFWAGDHISCSAYNAAGVASATSGAITWANGAPSASVKAGQLVATATSATSTAIQMGWAKTKAALVTTLFEASGQTVNDPTGNLYGSATTWISAAHANQKPVTFRWSGENSAAAKILVDAVCTGWELTWDSGQVSKITFNYSFYDYYDDSTVGGLVVPAAFQRVPQLVGSNNGRATIGGSVRCGLESCKIVYKCEVAEYRCHSATQGIAGVSYRKPRISVSMSVPYTTDDPIYDSAGSIATSGQNIWESRLEQGTTTSLACYVGSRIGRSFAFLVPAAKLSGVPQIAEVGGGAVGYSLEFEAGSYTGDSTDTAETTTNSPIDSIFRAGLV